MSLLPAKPSGRSSVWELSLNGVSVTNSTALSNAFGDHFSTIGSKLASEIPFNNGSSFQEYISGLSERFQLVSTDSNQVLSHFKKLNKSKGAGLDEISSRLILDCPDLICYISMICPIVCSLCAENQCAGDTHLTYSNGNIHSIQSSLNEDLLNINRWLTANKLTLNMTKTEFMLIGSRQKLNNLPSLPSLNINKFRIKHGIFSLL